MVTIGDILAQLKATTKKKEKLAILEQNKENADLKEFFRLALDKSGVSFHIKRVPDYGHVDEQTHTDLSDAMASLSMLSERRVTGNNAKDFLSDLLGDCGPDNAELIEKIIKRDPDCGVSLMTVNKIWPGLIFDIPVSKCKSMNSKNMEKIIYPCFAQLKADGQRISNFYNGKTGEVIQYSAGGHRFNFHGVMDTEMRNIAILLNHIIRKDTNLADLFSDGFILDGEGVVIDDDGKIMDRAKGNGIIDKAQCGTMTKEEASRVLIETWDIIPAKEFWDTKGRGSLTVRWALGRLKWMFKIQTSIKFKRFSLIDTVIVDSLSAAKEFYTKQVRKGLEGAILKNQESKWENRRNPQHVKMKLAEPVDMMCTGTYPHKKNPKWIGGINLESSCGRVKVNCGSGISGHNRYKQKDPSYFIGSVIKVKANGYGVSDLKDTYSLFLPIFKEKRKDKTQANSLEEIMDIFDNPFDPGE